MTPGQGGQSRKHMDRPRLCFPTGNSVFSGRRAALPDFRDRTSVNVPCRLPERNRNMLGRRARSSLAGVRHIKEVCGRRRSMMAEPKCQVTPRGSSPGNRRGWGFGAALNQLNAGALPDTGQFEYCPLVLMTVLGYWVLVR